MWASYSYHVTLLIFTIIFKATCHENSSLTFVIDNTLSMREDIEKVKQNSDEIIESILKKKAGHIKDLVLVTFNDPYASLELLTENIEVFKTKISNLQVHNNYGNHDCEEKSMEGILLGLQNSRPGSLVYIFTDASSKDFERSKEVIDMCKLKHIQTIFVLTGYCYDRHELPYQVYYDIAAACSGLAINVDKEDLSAVLLTSFLPTESADGNKNVIKYEKAPPYVYTDVPFEISNAIEIVQVIAYASNVDLKVQGPSATRNEIMWTDGAKGIELTELTAGMYKAVVSGDSEISVYIIDKSINDFEFKHGFSDFEPTKFEDSIPRVIANAKTYLSIKVTDPKHKIKIISAHILNMNETLIKELPLRRVAGDFYATERFKAPSQTFKVAVTGKIIRTNKVIRHIAEIPVIPQDPPTFAPIINSNHSIVYKGLEGDVALRIPCDAVGSPKPTIVWKKDGTVIIPDAHYVISEGALLIKDPKTIDSKLYTCEAKNLVGVVNATFEAKVDQYLDGYGTVQDTYILNGATKKLQCGASDPTQSVRWFMEGNELNLSEKHLTLENFDISRESNYTCRVSSMQGAYTITHAVEMGYAPTFAFNQEQPIFDWTGRENDMLDCEVVAKPRADVVWTFDGKVLDDQKSSRLAISGNWGHYTCNVSNVLGAVQRNFDVISSNCLIPRNPKNKHMMPLVLTTELTWPMLDCTTDYLKVPPGESLMLSCPNYKDEKNAFQNLPTLNEMRVTCDKQDVFLVNGKPNKILDLQCTHDIKPVVLQKPVECLSETSKLIRVGYDVHGFLETYEVCFDISKNIPLYTRTLMSKSNSGRSVSYAWYKYSGIGDGEDDIEYTCEKSMSSCCYSKEQLVNARDFSDGPAQNSTFIYPLNSIPLWRPCDIEKNPWNAIEDMVKSQFDYYPKFIVWSGVHMLQKKNRLTVPRYLWKVLRFDEDESIALVYVNGPSPTDADILCNNICADDSVPWIREHNKYTYCCSVDEFRQAFGLRNTFVGESMNTALNKIKSRNRNIKSPNIKS